MPHPPGAFSLCVNEKPAVMNDRASSYLLYLTLCRTSGPTARPADDLGRATHLASGCPAARFGRLAVRLDHSAVRPEHLSGPFGRLGSCRFPLRSLPKLTIDPQERTPSSGMSSAKIATRMKGLEGWVALHWAARR